MSRGFVQRVSFRQPGLRHDVLVVGKMTAGDRGWRKERYPMLAAIYNTFNVQRHLISRRTLRSFRAQAMADWNAAAAAA